MAQQLSLSARPRTLDGLVGQTEIVEAIRGHAASGRVIKAWMFTGPAGSGKTTIARILALALQCIHQERFGSPCADCYKHKSTFPIHEINMADATGVDNLRQFFAGADYGVFTGSRYRVYILDECHRMSDSAQDLALKFLEDTPETTVFILCSTNPHKIIKTLRSRCITYAIEQLKPDDVIVLVQRLLKRAKSNLAADRLVDQLNEKHVWSPRSVCQAVERYIAGQDPARAADVDTVEVVDTYGLDRCIVKGDWGGCAAILRNAQASDIPAIRAGVLGYLRTIILEEADFSKRGEVVAKVIETVCSLERSDSLSVSAGLAASLYRVCKMFNEYKR